MSISLDSDHKRHDRNAAKREFQKSAEIECPNKILKFLRLKSANKLTKNINSIRKKLIR